MENITVNANVSLDATNDEKPGGAADASKFAAALNRSLDAVRYTGGHRRTAQIAIDLELSRSQAYRLLCGLSFPSTDKLSALRRLGISVDRILDEIADAPVAAGPSRVLRLGTSQVRCQFEEKTSGRPAVVAREGLDGVFELAVLAPGERIAPGSVGLESLQFPARSSLAIVDDDELALSVLVKQFGQSFQVTGLISATALRRYEHGITGFDAFIIDWRLPDTEGDSLIREVRQQTAAPIFILTGDTSSSEAIAEALDQPNTHHVGKPADLLILGKRISACIALANAQRARSR